MDFSSREMKSITESKEEMLNTIQEGEIKLMFDDKENHDLAKEKC
jgi:hypothetical protein